MKHFLLAVALICFGSNAYAGPYFDTFFRDPSHPKISAQILYTSRFDFDGGVSDVALVYHKADPGDSLWPKTFLAAGIPPLSWTLLEVGGGGNTQTGFVHFGTSINVAPTVLGPAIAALHNAGGKAAAFGNLLVSPDGSGLKLSLGWKADVVENGGFRRFNELRFPPRYGIGYVYQF